MTDFYFLRHATTEWNLQKRLQGRTNIPLADEGISQLSQRTIPASLRDLRWFCSPLERARETASLLDINAASEQALIEMNWGDWEGQTLSELRSSQADLLAHEEARGLDLTPPAGESPRDVQTRLTAWAELMSNQDTEKRFGCVCHKGIIRAVYAAASHWNMLGKPPHKLNYNAIQGFSFSNGEWRILELNIDIST